MRGQYPGGVPTMWKSAERQLPRARRWTEGRAARYEQVLRSGRQGVIEPIVFVADRGEGAEDDRSVL